MGAHVLPFRTRYRFRAPLHRTSGRLRCAQLARSAVLAALCAFLLMGCAKPRPSALLAAPNTDGVLRLNGRFAAGHACPVSEDLALTAAHVTDIRPFDASMPAFPLQWSDGLGHEGVLEPAGVSRVRDLAVMTSAVPFARWYPIAQAAPAPGDRVWTIGFDWRTERGLYAKREFSARVLRVVARSLVFEDGSAPGASGACVLNARGELVAINVLHVQAEDGGAGGVAVGVWGESFKRPEDH